MGELVNPSHQVANPPILQLARDPKGTPFRACRFAMLAFAMAAEFTAAQVAAIAALAQLELEPDEVQLFARQLGDFLGYADEVLAIDTTGVAPTARRDAPGIERPTRCALARSRGGARTPDPARHRLLGCRGYRMRLTVHELR